MIVVRRRAVTPHQPPLSSLPRRAGTARSRAFWTLAFLLGSVLSCSDSRVPVEINPDRPPTPVAQPVTFHAEEQRGRNEPIDPEWTTHAEPGRILLTGWARSCSLSITGAEGDATRLRNEITVTVNLISGSAGAIGMASLEIDLTEVPPGTYLVRLVEGPWLCMQPRDGWPKTFTATVP